MNERDKEILKNGEHGQGEYLMDAKLKKEKSNQSPNNVNITINRIVKEMRSKCYLHSMDIGKIQSQSIGHGSFKILNFIYFSLYLILFIFNKIRSHIN